MSSTEMVTSDVAKSERPKRSAATKKKDLEKAEQKETVPKKATGGRRKKNENEAVVESSEPVNEKPEVAITKPASRGRKKAVKEPENDGSDDDATDQGEENENIKKISVISAKAGSKSAKTAPSEPAKLSENSPLAGSAVARCFSNVVVASDVKIELERLRAAFNADPAKAAADFQACLNRILSQYKSSTQLNLCSDLVQQFVSSENADYQYKFVAKLLSNMRVKEKAVRLRSAHLIRLWLRAQTEIAEDIHSLLLESMLESASDKNPLVRQEAMAALEFLQDPTNPEDRVIKTLCQAAERDPVAKVRKVALRVVSPTQRSIQTFVSRARDESDEVRLACWKELEERFQLAWFSSEQLMELFDQGLEDFSASCKTQAERTLLKWFSNEKQNDVVGLLESFDVEADEIFILHVLDVVASKYPKEKLADLSPAMCLSKSASIWLRYCCERKFEELDISATSLMEGFSQILQVMRHCKEENPANFYSCAFIAKQLILAVSSMELLHDPLGRGQVVRVLSESMLVEEFPSDLIDPMVKAMKRCSVDDSQFIFEVTTNVLSFLSELSPLDQVRADIMKAEQLIDDYTRAKNYASLPNLVAEIETLKEKEKELLQEQQQGSEKGSDLPSFSRLVRSTALVCSILKVISRQNKESLLSGLLDTCCVPALQSPEVEARMFGVEALGLLALRDIAIAKSHGILLARTFFQNEREEPQVRQKALQVLFDLLTTFGKDVCIANDSDSSSAKDFDMLIQYLMTLLEVDREPEIRCLAANGLTKLLFLGRVAYPGLVQCLLIVLFHPSTDSNPRLKQCLLTFFAEYKHSRVVLQAAEPLLEAMIQPGEESMCEDLPFDKVLERLCFLLRDQPELQLDFALVLLLKIGKYSYREPALVKVMTKTLTTMSLASVTTEGPVEEKLRRLRYGVDTAVKAHWLDGDKVSGKLLEKFVVSLDKLNQSASSGSDLPDSMRAELDTLITKEAGSAVTERGEGIAATRPKRAGAGKQPLKEGDDEDEDEEDSDSAE